MPPVSSRRPHSPGRVASVTLPADAPNDWNAVLEPGERLLWSGAPAQGLRWRRKDRALTGLTAFWTAMVAVLLARDVELARQGDDLEPGKLAILAGFILLGLYLTIGRFFWDARIRAQSRYALTDRRGIVAETSWRRRLTFMPISPTLDVVVERPGGTVFLLGPADAPISPLGGRDPRPRGGRGRLRSQRHKLAFAFIGAEEAEKVKDLALSAARALDVEDG